MTMLRKLLLALVCFSFLAGGPAWSQKKAAAKKTVAKKKKKKKKMVFTAEPVRDDSKARARLKAAVDLYKKGDYVTAALRLAEIADGPSEEFETVKDDADYYLAVSLYQLGFYLSSLNYFDRVVRRGAAHPHAARTVKWLALLAHRLQVDKSLLKKISTFPADKFQPEVRDELLYLLGRHYFNVGDSVRAASFLGAVSPKSKYYAKAKYFEGLVAVKDDSARDAVKAFRVVAELKDGGNNYEDFKWVKELGTLALARAYYSAERFKRSVERYRSLGKYSPLWLDSLFESSWSYFRLRQYEKALGNLFTLNTPFFEKEYYPESFIVQAVILFRNCKFARVRKTVERYKKRYVPLEKQLTTFLEKEGKNPADFWALYEKLAEGKRALGKGLIERVLAITLADNVLAKYRKYLAQFDRELEAIRTADKTFKDHPLARNLFQEVTLQRSFAVREAGKHAKARFARARDEIRRLLKQADVLLFEIENAEKNRLEEELAREQEIPKDQVAGGKIEKTTAVPPGWQYWPFEGEYWRDELGFYEYQIRSDCKAPAGARARGKRASR